MTHKTCLRCDWEGETQGPQCPNCGIQPLYVVGASPAAGQVEPVAGDPEERSREAPSTAPSGTPFPRSDPPPSPTEAVGSSSRSAARSVVAFVLVALVLGITLGTWLDASEERSAPAASSDAAAHETPAGDALTDGPLIGRQALTVDGVPFSFRVPRSGWEGFRNLHISKSTAGSQGAEALIYWSRFPGGVDADWCVLDHTEPGPSVAGVADAVSTATGTQLLTGPSDVTIGGRSAKYMVLIVREDVGCDPGFFYNWKAKLGGALWTETKPGDTISVWIVDVDGTLLFIAGETKPEAGPRLEQEIQQIVGSIRFD